MIRLRARDLPAVPSKIFGMRLTAVFETVVILGILLAIDAVAGNGNRFLDVQPHPFWIAVLLVSAQYGLENGLLAAVAASLALLLFNIPPIAPGEDILGQASTLAFNPALWIIGAVVVGGLSERHIARARDHLQALEIAETEMDILRQSVERLALTNESLENRVAGALTSHR